MPDTITLDKILTKLKSHANPKNVAGMARFGINPANTLGISIPELRQTAREIKKQPLDCHVLAIKLWDSGIHEAKILAGFIENTQTLTEAQMENWVKDFDSWDVCDQVCDLFGKSPFAIKKINDWTKRDEEFVKRAGFALMCEVSVHDKKAPDQTFLNFLPLIKAASTDERNFVKKAVNWALRNIGKRNAALNKAALKTAEKIQKINSKSARWIAADAIRELKTKFTS